jgi:signal transduction histidine kinase
MKPSDADYLNVGTRLTVTFVLLMVLILGGNGLVIWQFNLARTQTDRLAGANQQMIVVLQLQVNLLAFHQRLDDLARSRDFQRLVGEVKPLRRALHEQTQRTRSALASLPPETAVDPAFWPTLEAIEIMLPSQLDAIAELARVGDWAAVQLRLDNQLKPVETRTAILVDSVDRQASRDLTQAAEQMRSVQRRILILVPATAICSFLIAAFFGWSIARRIWELRLDERVTERMRIARDLHDTLLQSFHGLLLRFQTASELFPTRPAEAKQTLDSAIEQAAQAITEGRDAVQGLRSSTVVTNDLALAINILGEELAGGETNPNAAEFHLGVEGTPRHLHPILRDEVYRIAGEAMRNAFKHAQAQRIEVEIRYDERQFRLRVRDDGKGIDAKLLNEDERPGHYGLRGMRERAKLLGGKLTVWSEVETGTEVELSIPGAKAYATADGRRRSWLAEKFAGRFVEKDTERKS